MNDDVPLPAGTLLRPAHDGGGGWGTPSNASPELVLLDVLRGLVSVESASAITGWSSATAVCQLRRRSRRSFFDRGPATEAMRPGGGPDR